MSIFARKNFISNTSKIEVTGTSLIYTYCLSHSLFGYAENACRSYLFPNFNKRVSLEQ